MELLLDAWPILALPLGWLWFSFTATQKRLRDLEKSLNEYRIYVSETLLNSKIDKALKPIRDHLENIERKLDSK